MDVVAIKTTYVFILSKLDKFSFYVSYICFDFE